MIHLGREHVLLRLNGVKIGANIRMDYCAAVIVLPAAADIVRVAVPACTDHTRIVRPIVVLLVSSFGDLALVPDAGDHGADNPASLPPRFAAVLPLGRQ